MLLLVVNPQALQVEERQARGLGTEGGEEGDGEGELCDTHSGGPHVGRPHVQMPADTAGQREHDAQEKGVRKTKLQKLEALLDDIL
jgi:hypothetical protein